jgi:hypothetical protein
MILEESGPLKTVDRDVVERVRDVEPSVAVDRRLESE